MAALSGGDDPAACESIVDSSRYVTTHSLIDYLHKNILEWECTPGGEGLLGWHRVEEWSAP